MMEKKNSRQPKSNKAADPRTLFVKFHPPSAFITRQHLSDHFSNYGPVNRCSVIRQQKSKRQADAADEEEPNLDRGSKGYGFVRFVHEDDAKDAADAIRKKYQTKGRKSGEFMVVEGVRYKIHAERAVDAATATATQKKERGNKTSNKDKDTQQAKVKDVEVPVATVASKAKEDADTMYKAESKRKRTSRVIIRNLSFYANEKHIKSAMEESFGPVAAVDLPLVPNLPNEKNNNDHSKNNKNAVPRHRGFAFVTFTNANAAKQAVEQGSEITIKNRKVAIDFSVSKLEHQKMMKEAKNKKGKGGDTESESESSDSDSESDDENDGEKDSGEDSDGDSSDSDDDSSDSEESEDENEDEEEEDSQVKNDSKDDNTAEKETPDYDQTEAKRTLFLRNVPFDAKRHDFFELFRKFGRIEAVYLVKDRQTGVFKGTAFVRFENEKGSEAAMEASGISGTEQNEGAEQFVSSKNMAMGLGQDGSSSGLMLNGRHILVDLAVDRTTASSLAVQRDADGKPIKKMVGKDKRNLYLKSEGRVSSSTESAAAVSASAKHGGLWEDLPPSDRAKRERAFADKSTKLRSPLFFINPTRLSIRNLAKHINEAELKKLAFGALKTGMEQKLATPKDAVSHWRAGGELAHGEVMRRATDPDLVFPPLDDKNMKGSIAAVYVDRDVSGGKKTADAPSRGFGFVEFTHHAHALAVLRQLNNNPVYSTEFAAGGKHATDMAKRGKKGKKAKVDPETGAEFVTEDGRVCVPRLIVEFTVENKVKARQQAEKVAQKKANKIKQRIEKKEKDQSTDSKKEKKKSRGALQREKKRARKEAGEGDEQNENEKESKKQKTDTSTSDKPVEKKPKMTKPQKKKRKADKDEDALEDMIRSYKSSFSKGPAGSRSAVEESNTSEVSKKNSKEKVVKKRWFE